MQKLSEQFDCCCYHAENPHMQSCQIVPLFYILLSSYSDNFSLFPTVRDPYTLKFNFELKEVPPAVIVPGEGLRNFKILCNDD